MKITMHRGWGFTVGLGLALSGLVTTGVLLSRGRGPGRGQSAGAPIEKIIVLSVDALRTDRLGCYGYQATNTSPTIDAWAKEALLFERVYAQAPWTMPSMASLMSGRYSREAGAYTNSGDIVLRGETLAEQLHRMGYRTAFFNTNPVLSRKGIGRGFDVTAPRPTGKKIPYTSVEPLVMDWLDAHARDKFFVWIHDMDPHSPPTEGNPYLKTPGWSRYDAEVHWVDEAVGRLFTKLDALGIRDQVLFVFTADHGEAFGEHRLSGHQNVMYDEVLRVPLIVQYPGMARRGRVSEAIQLLDVNPTIAQLAGLPPPAVRRGESLVPITSDADAHVAHRYAFSTRYYFTEDRVDDQSGKVLFARGQHHLAVHGRNWKLIARVSGTSPNADEQPDWDTTARPATYELYNLAADPLEQHDVFTAQPDVALRLERALADWKQMTSGGPKDVRTAIDPATREAMRALGYDSN